MLRRIAGKGILSHIRKDLISGHEAAWESIIATMHKIYEEDKSESILLAEVSPKTFPHNVGIKCPLLQILFKIVTIFLPDFS